MSNQLKLFGLRGSVHSRFALLTLDEAGAQYELVLVPFNQLQTPEHLARHPFGKLPVLQDGDLQLFESRAISRYIASQYDKKGTLYPTDPRTRALIEQWISVEQSYFRAAEEVAVELIFSKIFGFEGNSEKARDATERLKKTLEVLDRHLATSTYFVGDTFTLADIVYIPFTFLLYTYINDEWVELLNSYKNFARWWKLVSERPTWKNIAAQSEFKNPNQKRDP